MQRDQTWAPNVVGRAGLVLAGRPRWLTLEVHYERSFAVLPFTNAGAVQDVASASVDLGPFRGFGVRAAASWARAELQDPSPEAGQAPVLVPFHTIGLALDLGYLREIGGLAVGPFFQGLVFSTFAEEAPYDLEYEHLPPGYDVVEATLLLGCRIQWGMDRGRSGRAMDLGPAGVARSQAERRLSLYRQTREERAEPAERRLGGDADEIFGRYDPFGRVEGEFEPEEEEGAVESEADGAGRPEQAEGGVEARPAEPGPATPAQGGDDAGPGQSPDDAGGGAAEDAVPVGP
jgi:hypothetical protein